MSDYELRPHINKAKAPPDYNVGGGKFSLWILGVAIALAAIFAIMFFAGSGDTPFEGSGDGALQLPGSLETAPAPGAQPPVPIDE